VVRQRSRGESPYASPEWRRLSREVRAERPWCEGCGGTTDLTVDHITPLVTGQSPIVPKVGLRVLCRSCHGRVTQHKGRVGQNLG
jgi:5-methylcytosine-specific restriction protein A